MKSDIERRLEKERETLDRLHIIGMVHDEEYAFAREILSRQKVEV